MAIIKILLLSLLLFSTLPAKSRRTTLRRIPSADFIGSGELQIGSEQILRREEGDDLKRDGNIYVDLGISEWMSFSSLFSSDGISLGLKGRILNEATGGPSLAFGVRSLVSNEHLLRLGRDADIPEELGEIYLALSRSYEPLTIRFHGGVATTPSSRDNSFNYFLGVEKYVGDALYLTFEGWSVADRFFLSFFSTFRLLSSQRAEFVFGITDLHRFLFNDRGDLVFDLYERNPHSWVHPSLSFQLNYLFSFPFGAKPAFRTLDDSYRLLTERMSDLEMRVEALSIALRGSEMEKEVLAKHLIELQEEVKTFSTEPPHYSTIYGLIQSYSTVFRTEPLDIQRLNLLREELRAWGSDAEAVFNYIVKSPSHSRGDKIVSVRLMGIFQLENSVVSLLDLLAETKDTRLKIEILSALGAIGDRSVRYAISHFAESSNEILAMVASEVLLQWDGGEVAPPLEDAPLFIVEPEE